MAKTYNHKLIKNHRSYTIEQLCNIYKSKKLHAQTIRNTWIKKEKLPAISNNPIAINGLQLKYFLEQRNKRAKVKLDFNQFKCVKCTSITTPKDNKISISHQANKSIVASACCSFCNTKVKRFYKADSLPKLQALFKIKQDTLTSLINTKATASKTQAKDKSNTKLFESLKKNNLNSIHSTFKTHLATNKNTSNGNHNTIPSCNKAPVKNSKVNKVQSKCKAQQLSLFKNLTESNKND